MCYLYVGYLYVGYLYVGYLYVGYLHVYATFQASISKPYDVTMEYVAQLK